MKTILSLFMLAVSSLMDMVVDFLWVAKITVE